MRSWVVATGIVLLSLPAWAGKPYVVEVAVVDASGGPVTSAWVQFTAEGTQTHKVHGETGRWTNNGLDLPTGERQPFARGQAVTFDVWADGFDRQRVETTLDGKKGAALTVTLATAPATPEASSAPDVP